MLASFVDVGIWWLASVVLSVVAWPLTYRLFRFLPDRGLGFSRLVGWLFTGYAAYLMGFVANSRATSALAWLALALLSWTLYRGAQGEHRAFLKANSALVFFYEVCFFVLFFVWTFVRMKHPNIEGQEKFMDFAFFNSMQRSARMPPMDPWLAGATHYVNYYYFGYFLNAAFARMTFIGPDRAYNLAVSNDFALCGLAMLALGYNLTKSLWAGLVACAGLELFGNLHGALQVLGVDWNGGFNWWEPTRLIKDVWANGHYLNAWWWSASPSSLAKAGLGPGAVQDALISEFPAFSLLHGDLHPHVSSMPLALLVLALALNLARDPSESPLALGPGSGRRWEGWLALVLALGAVFMGNTWDLPAYGLCVSVALLGGLHAGGSLRSAGDLLRRWLLPSVLLVVGLLLVSAPFWAFFENPTHGFGMSGAHTGMRDTLVFWGLFLAVLVPYSIARVASLASPGAPVPGTPASRQPRMPARICPVCGTKLRAGKDRCGHCGTVWEAAAQGEPTVLQPPAWASACCLPFRDPAAVLARPALAAGTVAALALWTAALVLWPTVGIFGALAALSVLTLAARGGEREGVFTAALILTGSLAVLLTECVFLRDAFSGTPQLTRMNTVFKFYFQAWILFSAALPMALIWTLRRLLTWSRGAALAYAAVFAVLSIGALVYPVEAVAYVWDDFDQNAGMAPTLNGAAWLQRSDPGDFEAIQAMRKFPGQPVIAEAEGGAYTHFARVSAYTGFRAIVGWGNHESQWRPEGWPLKQQNDVDELYTTTDTARALQILDAYGVDYVFVGTLERRKYGAGVDKFARLLGPPVIDTLGTQVYRVVRPGQP